MNVFTKIGLAISRVYRPLGHLTHLPHGLCVDWCSCGAADLHGSSTQWLDYHNRSLPTSASPQHSLVPFISLQEVALLITWNIEQSIQELILLPTMSMLNMMRSREPALLISIGLPTLLRVWSPTLLPGQWCGYTTTIPLPQTLPYQADLLPAFRAPHPSTSEASPHNQLRSLDHSFLQDLDTHPSNSPANVSARSQPPCLWVP